MESADQDAHAIRVTLSPECRALRRSLGLTTWAVFEDVVMDTTRAGDCLIAATSARQVAEHLAVTPATAASALRRLRHRGLLVHERLTGPGGRFGLSVYRVQLVDGIALAPYVNQPRVAPPRAEDRHAAPTSSDQDGRVEQAIRGRQAATTQQLTLPTDVEVGGE
jgi:hypothetical protein